MSNNNNKNNEKKKDPEVTDHAEHKKNRQMSAEEKRKAEAKQRKEARRVFMLDKYPMHNKKYEKSNNNNSNKEKKFEFDMCPIGLQPQIKHVVELFDEMNDQLIGEGVVEAGTSIWKDDLAQIEIVGLVSKPGCNMQEMHCDYSPGGECFKTSKKKKYFLNV